MPPGCGGCRRRAPPNGQPSTWTPSAACHGSMLAILHLRPFPISRTVVPARAVVHFAPCMRGGRMAGLGRGALPPTRAGLIRPSGTCASLPDPEARNAERCGVVDAAGPSGGAAGGGPGAGTAVTEGQGASQTCPAACTAECPTTSGRLLLAVCARLGRPAVPSAQPSVASLTGAWHIVPSARVGPPTRRRHPALPPPHP